MLRWTDGFSHIALFIAGANSDRAGEGQEQRAEQVVRQAVAALARRSAEAGATQSRSAFSASSMCAPSG